MAHHKMGLKNMCFKGGAPKILGPRSGPPESGVIQENCAAEFYSNKRRLTQGAKIVNGGMGKDPPRRNLGFYKRYMGLYSPTPYEGVHFERPWPNSFKGSLPEIIGAH